MRAATTSGTEAPRSQDSAVRSIVGPMANTMTGVRVVIVDADTVAGWRRVTPSLAQLESAVSDLRRFAPGAVIVILGDPSLRWALSNEDKERLDDWIDHQQVVLAPAGTIGGHVGFIAAASQKAKFLGMLPVVITDRAVPDCPIARMRRIGERWLFDLDNATVTQVVASTASQRQRRRKPARTASDPAIPSAKSVAATGVPQDV